MSSGKLIQARFIRVAHWGGAVRGFFAGRMREARKLRFQPLALDRTFLRSGSRVLGGFRSWLSRPPFRVPTWVAVVVLVVLAVAAFGFLEARTAIFQSTFLPVLDSWLTWHVAPGSSGAVIFPHRGPYDTERGYSRLPEFQTRLEARGYQLLEQARFSPALALATRIGLSPPIREKPFAWLKIRSRDEGVIYDAARPVYRIQSMDSVPPLVIRSLLVMENRQLVENTDPRANPAVDWGRLARAAVLATGSKLGLPVKFQGGSTLAVQIEKYRHSEGGRTGSVGDKVRQIASASLRAYRDGSDTRAAQQTIILDYLNTVPLGAAPGYGEVDGIGEGLRVWFGLDPARVFADLTSARSTRAKAKAYKPVLALLCSVRSPNWLSQNRKELDRRVTFYQDALCASGVIDKSLRNRLAKTPIRFHSPELVDPTPYSQRKASDLVRRELVSTLGLRDLYELDRLDLAVTSTFDATLQDSVVALFNRLGNPEVAAAHGLYGQHLLGAADPGRIAYSLLLVEHTPGGELVRVQADNLNGPFDLNSDMRMELGSTAKLRTLGQYLQIVERLHGELYGLDRGTLAKRASAARDPITAWATQEHLANPEVSVDTLFQHALNRTYSASPYESFYTGGGVHVFHNFDPDDNGRILTIREALVHSTNLVFVRLMRDIVRYEEARLPYDVNAVMSNSANPIRQRLLVKASDQESRQVLWHAYSRLRGATPAQIPTRLLGVLPPGPKTTRRLSILYFAWNSGASASSLSAWLAQDGIRIAPDDAAALTKKYGNLRFGIKDYAYLLGHHPLEIWCAREIYGRPNATWDVVLDRSTAVRQQAQRWLFDPRLKRAQDLRLRTIIEQDAFDRIAVDWRRLAFPFQHLVPSYATAIGSSADRPEALAELIGIVVNDGVRRPPRFIRDLRFGADTPYEALYEKTPDLDQRVMSVSEARALRGALGQVVARGTAERLNGAFRTEEGDTISLGGKTGSGDNRLHMFAHGGRLIATQAVNRTATFVFYLGDRYYGVLTASVSGPRAGDYTFTSALPLQVLKLLAPQISRSIQNENLKPGSKPVVVARAPDATPKTQAPAAPPTAPTKSKLPAKHAPNPTRTPHPIPAPGEPGAPPTVLIESAPAVPGLLPAIR